MILLAIQRGSGYIYAWPIGCFNVLFGMRVLCFNAADYGLCVNICVALLFLPSTLNFSLEALVKLFYPLFSPVQYTFSRQFVVIQFSLLWVGSIILCAFIC